MFLHVFHFKHFYTHRCQQDESPQPNISTSCSPQHPPHLSIEYVSIVVDIISQKVGLGSHQQRVPSGVWSQLSCRQTGDGLVDVEQRDV